MRANRINLALALLAVVTALADVAAVADDPKPEKVLEGRGLKRSGMLYVLDAESDFVPRVAKLQPSYRQLKASYDKFAAVVINQAEYDALNDRWTLVNEQWGNVRADIDAHPPLSNNELKQNWQNLLDAEKQLRYQYNELRREVNLRYPRLVNDSERERLQGEFLKQREEFLEKSRELRELADKIKTEYSGLSQDGAVKKALAALKISTKARISLGPSPEYRKASDWLTKAVRSTSPESVKPVRRNVKNAPKAKGTTPKKGRSNKGATKGTGAILRPREDQRARGIESRSQRCGIRLRRVGAIHRRGSKSVGCTHPTTAAPFIPLPTPEVPGLMGVMIRRLLAAGLTFTIVLACCAAAQESTAPPSSTIGTPTGSEGLAFFENKVRPILAEHCYRCHGPDSGAGKGELRVDSLEALLKGGVSGPAIVRGEPGRSLLILAVRHEGDVAMPPKKKLAAAEIEALTAWVKMGCSVARRRRGPRPTRSRTAAPSRDGPSRPGGSGRSGCRRTPTPPPVIDAGWPRSPIDRFILARLEAAGLRPAPPADKRTLLRRATLDLLGIPPIARRDRRVPARRFSAGASSASSTACSPRRATASAGAGTGSTSPATPTPTAWTTTSPTPTPGAIAITSSARSTPTSRSTGSSRSRSPATCSPNRNRTRRDELIVATGFLAIGPKMLAEDDPVKQQMDIVDEQLDTTCRVFLGLTMGCAALPRSQVRPAGDERLLRPGRDLQEHADDALASRRLEVERDGPGRLAGGAPAGRPRADHRPPRQRAGQRQPEQDVRRRARRPHAQLLEEARKEYAAIPKAMAVAEGRVGDLEIFLRGNHLTRGPVVPRRFPTILAGADQPPIEPERTAAGSSWPDG